LDTREGVIRRPRRLLGKAKYNLEARSLAWFSLAESENEIAAPGPAARR
jgi:hypothetical protein